MRRRRQYAARRERAGRPQPAASRGRVAASSHTLATRPHPAFAASDLRVRSGAGLAVRIGGVLRDLLGLDEAAMSIQWRPAFGAAFRRVLYWPSANQARKAVLAHSGNDRWRFRPPGGDAATTSPVNRTASQPPTRNEPLREQRGNDRVDPTRQERVTPLVQLPGKQRRAARVGAIHRMSPGNHIHRPVRRIPAQRAMRAPPVNPKGFSAGAPTSPGRGDRRARACRLSRHRRTPASATAWKGEPTWTFNC